MIKAPSRAFFDSANDCYWPEATHSGHSGDVIASLLNFNQRATGSTLTRPINSINE
jgi:hypothetical protein